MMNPNDFQNILQNLQQSAQSEMKKMQDKMASQQFEGSAGGGKVIAKVNGRQEVLEIRIDPEVVNSDPDEVTLLEDMVAGAVNQAIEKSRSSMSQEFGNFANGMNIPGLDMNSIMNMFNKK